MHTASPSWPITQAYHRTRHPAQVLREGLRPGAAQGLTYAGEWADTIYGGRPLYFSLDPDRYAQGELLRVRLPQGPVLPDLPGLVDLGAIVGEEGLAWEEGQEPQDLLPWLDPDGFVDFPTLLEDPQVVRAAVAATRTLALAQAVPATHIERNPGQAPVPDSRFTVEPVAAKPRPRTPTHALPLPERGTATPEYFQS